MEWQPIETAPKDGSWILVFEPVVFEPCMHVVQWGESQWSIGSAKTWVTMALGPNPDTYDADQSTHWMPLPASPKAPNVANNRIAPRSE